MKTHSPLIILAIWLTALAISSLILYSCGKREVLPGRGDCQHHTDDTTTTSVDTAAQN